MGEPAAVMGDQVIGTCMIHLIPNPTSGVPQPGTPFPFSAPLVQSVAASVLIGGKPAVVMGSTGYNTPPHVGLHPADPFVVPTTQIGSVVAGSATVLLENRPAAKTGSACVMCGGAPGQLVGTAANVLVGG